MSSPRIRRLTLDADRLQNRFRNWPLIEVTSSQGDPPEKYQITYNIQGLYTTPNGQIFERQQHIMEISLSLAYPRRAPQCKMLTPIFHPNFDEASVCIGDFWAASEGLDDLVVRIGRMIAYQEYNTKSPLNGLAARWADQQAHMLPVDNREIAPPSAPVAGGTEDKVVVRFDNESEAEALENFVSGIQLVPPAEGAGAFELTPAAELAPMFNQEPAGESVQPLAPLQSARLNFGMIAVRLTAPVTMIGRGEDNHVQLVHDSISNYHAEIELSEYGRILLKTVDPAGSTAVNGIPMVRTLLNDGDQICFGDLEATFQTS